MNVFIVFCEKSGILTYIMKLKIVLFILLYFIFCTKEKDVQTLKIGIPSDIGSLDPLFATDLMSRKLNSLYFRKLFRKGKEGQIEKDLAYKYSWNQNKLLVQIQDDFLNSNDVVYSLTRTKTTEHPLSFLYNSIQEIKKISEHEISLSCKCDLEELLDILSNPASSIYKAYSDQKNYVSKKNISLLNWSRGNEVLLEYLHPKFTKIKLQVIANAFTGIYLFSNQQLHIFKIPYFFYNHPSLGSGRFLSLSGSSVQYIAINHKNPCFDKYFRLALNLGIDKEKIIQKIFFGLAQTTYTSFPKKYTHQALQIKDYIFEYSPDLAKGYLQKSICYEKLKKQSLDFRMRADDENKAKGLAIAHYMQELGLKVKLHPMEKAPLYKENGEGKGDLTLLTWYVDYDSALNFVDPLFASDKFGNAGNRSFYKNLELDKIIQKSRKNFLLTKEFKEKVMNILFEDLPWVFLWSLNENYLVQTNLDLEEINDFLF